MSIFKITDSRTFRKLNIEYIQLTSRIVRYDPEAVREFIKNNKQ